jgi:hypothetical protein
LVRVGVFQQPTYVTAAPDDTHRLFVVEKRGVIVFLVNGHRLARPFLSVSRLVNASGEEQALLSMAFAPDYDQSGRFYVDYTGANWNRHIVRCRHAGNSNVAGGRAPGPC